MLEIEPRCGANDWTSIAHHSERHVYSLQTPALYAQTILRARVLLSGASVTMPSKMPARMARTTSSPIEQTKKETFAKRLRVNMPSVS